MRILKMLLVALPFAMSPVSANDAGTGADRARIELGLQIAPLPLQYDDSARELVGLGSYLLNAVAACAECHSPEFNPFAADGNPYKGEPEKFDAARYLIGGAEFEGFVSRNLRPDKAGRPAGLTFEQFLEVMRHGKDFKPELGPPNTPTLQFMTWPFYAHMTEHDLRAIYEYLKALPSPLPRDEQAGN